MIRAFITSGNGSALGRTIVILAVAATLVACSGSPAPSVGPGTTTPRDLAGTAWRAILLRDAVPIAGAEPTIRFEPGQAGGTTGCNTYGGTWALKADGSFRIDSMSMTEMACGGARGTQEGVVLDILQHADRLEFLADGRIRIAGSAGSITFVEDPR